MIVGSKAIGSKLVQLGTSCTEIFPQCSLECVSVSKKDGDKEREREREKKEERESKQWEQERVHHTNEDLDSFPPKIWHKYIHNKVQEKHSKSWKKNESHLAESVSADENAKSYPIFVQKIGKSFLSIALLICNSKWNCNCKTMKNFFV